MIAILPDTTAGIAARYAAQLRELLALRSASADAFRETEPEKPQIEEAPASRTAIGVDLRI